MLHTETDPLFHLSQGYKLSESIARSTGSSLGLLDMGPGRIGTGVDF